MELKEDIVVKQGGKMMMMKHGELKPLDMVVRLSNGARVAMDGTITMPDGTSRMLMDGEAMTMDGEMTTVEDMRDNLGNKLDNQ